MNDQPQTVLATATLGVALRELGMNPKPGRLLDVRGEVLKTGVYPAKILVNGKRANNQTPLLVGDAVQVIPGRDHTEETYEKRVEAKGEQATDPQYVLGTAPGYEVTTIGKESGKIESVRFDPSGQIDSPRAMALCFDDGPSPAYTKRILKILHRYHVDATFFVIGYEAQKYPKLVKREEAQGNVVGSHSWNHPEKFASLDEGQLEKQFSQTAEVLDRIGVHYYLFKPPGGSVDGQVVEMARRYGQRVVMWSIDTHDWMADKTAKEITKSVLSHAKPGGIVLMHDGGGDQSATVKALPDIIKGLHKKGYDLVAIPQNG